MQSIKGLEAFQKEVKESNSLCLVDFWGTSCAPCITLNKTLEGIEPEFENIDFVKVDADSEPEIAAENGIRGLPTLVLFRAGEEVTRWYGLVDSKKLSRELKDLC